MRILILGAGGIGGYFGARLHHAGADVTFLVRPARAEQLRAKGLHVTSPLGDIHVSPRVIVADELRRSFDLVVLTCKAYDLISAIESVAPAMGRESVVLPLLNGVAHLEALDSRFGRERTLGGVAYLAVTLTPDGKIKHLNNINRLMLGARGEKTCGRLSLLAEFLSSTPVETILSKNIEQEIWDKFVFLSTLAGATCTMRASVGEILETDYGETFILELLRECEQVAATNNRTPNAKRLAEYRAQLTERGSGLTASMLRDIERGVSTEVDHIIGDIVRRGKSANISAPLLSLAHTHLQAYELRRGHWLRA